jgi:hypothetical protein
VARLLFILVPLLVAFWVYSVVDCAIQPATRHRGVSKPIWILIVLFLPVLGGILWFIVGRTRRSSRSGVTAPDDDPAFLERLGSQSDQDERIRRLEEELAQLDAEDDDPKWNPPPHVAPEKGAADGAAEVPPKPAPGEPGDGDDARGHRGAVG